MAACSANRVGRIRSGVLNWIPAVVELHAALAALVKFGSYDALCEQQRILREPESRVALFRRNMSVSTLRALSAATEPECKRTQYGFAAAAAAAFVHLAVDPFFGGASVYPLHCFYLA